jgi:hypothetical protein
MVEMSGWQQGAGESAKGRLFYFACELDSSAEGEARRQQEKYRMLLSARVTLPAEEWQEGIGMWLADEDCNAPPCPYPGGASPGGAMGGSMGGGMGGSMGGGGTFGGGFGGGIGGGGVGTRIGGRVRYIWRRGCSGGIW